MSAHAVIGFVAKTYDEMYHDNWITATSSMDGRISDTNSALEKIETEQKPLLEGCKEAAENLRQAKWKNGDEWHEVSILKENQGRTLGRKQDADVWDGTCQKWQEVGSTLEKVSGVMETIRKDIQVFEQLLSKYQERLKQLDAGMKEVQEMQGLAIADGESFKTFNPEANLQAWNAANQQNTSASFEEARATIQTSIDNATQTLSSWKERLQKLEEARKGAQEDLCLLRYTGKHGYVPAKGYLWNDTKPPEKYEYVAFTGDQLKEIEEQIAALRSQAK